MFFQILEDHLLLLEGFKTALVNIDVNAPSGAELAPTSPQARVVEVAAKALSTAHKMRWWAKEPFLHLVFIEDLVNFISRL